ncbi:MAG: GNAT family N-acetyltransferase [Gammaproteobacteria bacterium]|nr:GNAT family N-acetyltransferase [Gammaproteobacteria bacterium]
MTKASIRSANKKDAPAIRAVHLAAGKGPDSLERNNQSVLMWLEGRVPLDYVNEMSAEHFVVAEVAGQIVGFGALHLDKEEITSVYVDPAFTRRGIASSLVSELEKEALCRGIPTLALQAAGGALLFYEKQGYSYISAPVKGGPLWADMRKQLL